MEKKVGWLVGCLEVATISRKYTPQVQRISRKYTREVQRREDLRLPLRRAGPGLHEPGAPRAELRAGRGLRSRIAI